MPKSVTPVSVLRSPRRSNPREKEEKEKENRIKNGMKIEDPKRCLLIEYFNPNGDSERVKIKPIEIEYTTSIEFPLKQWFLRAKDLETNRIRFFPLTKSMFHPYMTRKNIEG